MEYQAVTTAVKDLKKMGLELYKDRIWVPYTGIENPYGKRTTIGRIDWSEITDVEMRISEAGLRKKERPKWLRWLPQDRMDIYFTSIAVDDQKPMNLNIETFKRMKRGKNLPINHPCFYRNEEGKVPRFIDYRASMIRSRKSTREAGEIMQEVIEDSRYKEITDMLSLLKPPTSEMINLAANVALGIISKYLKSKEDDQLLFTAGSLNKKIDNLGLGLSFKTESDDAYMTLRVRAA